MFQLEDVDQDPIDIYIPSLPSLVVSEPAMSRYPSLVVSEPRDSETIPTTPTATTIFSPGQETLLGVQQQDFDTLENIKETNPKVTINVGGVKHEVI